MKNKKVGSPPGAPPTKGRDKADNRLYDIRHKQPINFSSNLHGRENKKEVATKESEEKHYIRLIDVESKRLIYDGEKEYTESDFKDQVVDALEDIAKKAKNCKACGGLDQEIKFVHKGKEFSFTCYKIINRKGVPIKKTDYVKLGEWCRATEAKP